ncbi:hypothetical protein BC939DRAFT_456762 [Gamsiella multidivaricata]|uniref:uncharacterized protein n=1 Tax=Gamsiella multidivaricata TaxID=101098 RepID=UPI00221F6D41|nr:uncharacterized protein BC939DRAFT_456762 [Gamsiella multidivaricata]KAI7820984.1 hypothetical protein BC939DRAFT_456762 [Gamsiella multidivaricata]
MLFSFLFYYFLLLLFFWWLSMDDKCPETTCGVQRVVVWGINGIGFTHAYGILMHWSVLSL